MADVRTLLPVVEDYDSILYQGDAVELLREMADDSICGVVTSPPYLDMRPEYGSEINWLEFFIELTRVVRGGIALNVGRLWRGGIEQMWWLDLLEDAQNAGLELFDTAIWLKPNANPIQGRVLANSHEYVFLLGVEGARFYPENVKTEYAPGSIERLERRWVSSISVKGDGPERNGPKRLSRRGERREGDPSGARARSFFIAYTGREKGNPHPAPMPIELADWLVCLVAPDGEKVLDPFAGSGTTLVACRRHHRIGIGIELEAEYCKIASARLAQQTFSG